MRNIIISIKSPNHKQIKQKIQKLSIHFQPDFLLDDVVFATVSEHNFKILKMNTDIVIKPEAYAYLTNNVN